MMSKTRKAPSGVAKEDGQLAMLDLSHILCMEIPDMRLSRFGISQGDLLFCDRELSPARFIIAEWDGLGHVCTMAGQLIFDEAGHAPAPEGSVIIGRVLYAVHPLIRKELMNHDAN